MIDVIRFIFMIAKTVLWHLFRIATCRPAYDKLGDTWTTFAIFAFAFWAAAILRWHEAVFLNPLGAISLLAARFMVIIFVTLSPNRTKSFASVLLGVSAAADLGVVLIRYVFAFETPPTVLLEMWVSAVCVYQFMRLPQHVKAAGYRPDQDAGAKRGVS